MAHMHRLGDVGAAVVHQHAARRRCDFGAVPRVGRNDLCASAERRVGEFEVDEAWTGDLDGGEARIPGQARGHGRGEVARVPAHTLGGGQGAIGLEVGKVGTVGGGDPAEVSRQAFLSEGGGNRFAQDRFQIAHRRWVAVPAASDEPALTRNRFPCRLKSAIFGVTSKPISTSKLAPEVVVVPRGMTMLLMASVT